MIEKSSPRNPRTANHTQSGTKSPYHPQSNFPYRWGKPEIPGEKPPPSLKIDPHRRLPQQEENPESSNLKQRRVELFVPNWPLPSRFQGRETWEVRKTRYAIEEGIIRKRRNSTGRRQTPMSRELEEALLVSNLRLQRFGLSLHSQEETLGCREEKHGRLTKRTVRPCPSATTRCSLHPCSWACSSPRYPRTANHTWSGTKGFSLKLIFSLRFFKQRSIPHDRDRPTKLKHSC